MSRKELVKITVSDFTRIASLGAGASGDVWKVRATKPIPYVNPEDFLALKLYKKDILE